MSKKRRWTADEEALLKKRFADTLTATLAQQLNRNYGSVAQHAALMGLTKSEAFLKSNLSGRQNVTVNGSHATRFIKGQVPHNKGKAMSPALYQKCAPTMFQKGNQPHNTKWDGFERVNKDGLIEVRVQSGRFVAKQRLIYETAYGPLDKGQIVVFADKNNRNFDLSNLQAITRVQNMERNTIQRYPAELKQTLQLLGKLKRTIDEKQN